MTHPHNENPVNPINPLVATMFLLMVGIEIALNLGARGLIGGRGAVGWRNQVIETYGFSDTVFEWMVTTGSWPMDHLVRFVTYPFIHGSFYHMLFAAVILLAMGKIVSEGMSGLRVAVIFVISGIVGALVWALLLDDPRFLVGGYPPVYGLIGAFTYQLWLRLGETGAPQTRAFTLIAFLLGIQLVFGVLFGGGSDWVADIAGFVTGFAMAVVMVDGGWTRFLRRVRRQ
ncbi:rhomboid family intramembrane serine protease [Thalassococcus lentus]|uniref:Rhomboid family intramembrane serine protease n=1 Tax=Thalassococcus lentus TaxID=1210524 RepID=A0ABT4XWD4_9RHOB|nr:rhomboid family intramembrane serine protease [Thalassococcus lentus]MDA7426278.1 rhomboid family intramembrane serine protease [Thalassococcus lentus]